jgi:hypothetical protein
MKIYSMEIEYFLRRLLDLILSGVQDLSWTSIFSGVQDLSWTSIFSGAQDLSWTSIFLNI